MTNITEFYLNSDHRLPELKELESIITEYGSLIRHQVIGTAQDKKRKYPLHMIQVGSESEDAPVVAFIGGVHGLERIGTQVVLSLLRSFLETLRWDDTRRKEIENLKVIFIPLLNPTGMANRMRSNFNGVDLMRNAPVDASQAKFLVGGQSYTSKLPWYRGAGFLEPENEALHSVFKQHFANSPFVLSVDFHSGFGLEDRIWFPWAKSQEPFPQIAEAFALRNLLEKTHPYLWYKFEPQALSYTTHGDIWDWFYEIYKKKNPDDQKIFLPLTLEMGSWLWVRKSPLQMFSLLGPFNPLKPHRHRRILRRHQTLFDFILRSAISHKSWLPKSDERILMSQRAQSVWYES